MLKSVKRLVKSAAIILFITCLIVLFQNCTQKPGTSLLGSKSSADLVGSKSIDAPLAYDLVVDTISYNSCVGDNLNQNGIHGIKIGVNEVYDSSGNASIKSGLKLNTEFLQFVGRNVNPTYPSTTITETQIQYVIKNSEANQKAYIQFAVRNKSDLKTTFDLINPGSNTTATIQRDGNYETSSLISDTFLPKLTKGITFTAGGAVLTEGSRIFNLNEEAAPKAIESSFAYSKYYDETYPSGLNTSANEPFGIGEYYSEAVRKKFNSGSADKIILTQTYGDPYGGDNEYGLNNPSRPVSNDNTKAYGKGFALKFEAPSTAAGWRHRQVLLKQVTETNLSNNSSVSGANWTCENFVITKQTHWNNTKINEAACVPLIAADLQNATVLEKVKKIRRHYSEENWNVGLFFPASEAYNPATRATRSLCLAPKQQECYLKTNEVLDSNKAADIGINYSTNTECYVYPHTAFGISYSGGLDLDGARQLGRCAHYASICIR